MLVEEDAGVDQVVGDVSDPFVMNMGSIQALKMVNSMLITGNISHNRGIEIVSLAR